MDINAQIDNILSFIIEWLKECKIGATEEKTKQIAREIFWLVKNHNISENDIYIIKEKLKTEPFSMEEGNLWSFIQKYYKNDKYVEFFRDISELTPCGLNTSPNACCGKYELLWRLLLPTSLQPKKGDILYNGQICELKGSDVRILDTKLTGGKYKQNCKKILDGQIVGNIVKTGGLSGSTEYEIEKKQHRDHYQKEFEKIDITVSKKLMSEYLNENGWPCLDEEVECIFENGIWNQDIMQKLILKKMFIKYKQKTEFDKMYIFGDGTNVKIISTPEDLEKVQITKDFFRINHEMNVGWYIS